VRSRREYHAVKAGRHDFTSLESYEASVIASASLDGHFTTYYRKDGDARRLEWPSLDEAMREAEKQAVAEDKTVMVYAVSKPQEVYVGSWDPKTGWCESIKKEKKVSGRNTSNSE
jgi:hypothetical protein